MNIAYQVTLLLVSIIALPLFADKLIDSSVRIARALRVSKTFIGLTLLAYGSTLPEFTISTIAARHSSQISIGNIFGSNIFNIAVVIGIMAYSGSLRISKKQGGVKTDAWFLTGVVALLLGMLYFSGGIGLPGGVLLFSILIVYSIYALRKDREENRRMKKHNLISMRRESAIIILGLAGVLVSGKLAVGSAVNVARLLGISEWVIGVTILAVGTSLPELAISIVATKKKEMSISLGNIIGACICNLLWVLGTAAMIHPLAISFTSILMDAVFVAITTLILLYYVLKGGFTRNSGILLLLIYFAYITYTLL